MMEPLILILFLATVVVSFSAIERNTQCASALMISLVAAQTFTPGDNAHYHGVVMFFCAVVCLLSFKKGQLLVDVEGYEVNYAVAFIYLVRQGFHILVVFGLLTFGTMWYFSIALLVVQLALVAGGVTHGERLNNFIAYHTVRHISRAVPS